MEARTLAAVLVVCGCGGSSLERHQLIAERVVAATGDGKVYWMQADSVVPTKYRLFQDSEVVDEMSGPVPGEGGREYIALSLNCRSSRIQVRYLEHAFETHLGIKDRAVPGEIEKGRG